MKEAPADILVVDDSPDVIRLLTSLLTGAGYAVRPATGGRQALASAREKRPDLVLLDIRMPELSGLEVFRLMKETPELETVPVIFLSGVSEKQERVEALALGAADFVLKPFEKDELLMRVANHLAIHRLTEQLRANELKYQTLVESSPDLIARFDTNLRHIYVNRAAAAAGALRQEDYAGKTMAETGVPPEAAARWEDRFRQALSSGATLDVEDRFVTPAGERWFNTKLVPEPGPDGRPASLLSVARDVTSLRAAGAEARESAELFRAMFEGHAAVKLIIDPGSGKIIDANPAAAAFYGRPRADLQNKPLKELSLTPETLLMERLLCGSTGGGARFEAEHLIADGSRRDVEMYMSGINVLGKRLVHAIVHDISEKKRAEAALRESEGMFRALFEDNSAFKLILDCEDLRIVDANKAAVDFYGWTKEELLRKRISDISLVAPEDIRINVCEMNKKGQKHFIASHRLADGSVREVEVFNSVIKIGEKELAQSILHDVTDRRAVEKERERLAMAIEQAGEAVMITDRDAAILYVNPAFERVTGYSRAEMLGRNPRLLQSGRQDAEFYREMWGKLAAGERWSGRLLNKRKDGSFYTEDTVISPVRDENGMIISYVGVKRDVTEQLALEERLRHSQKMESVGQLAGGVAHDFNNLLTGIIGYAGMLKKGMPPGDPKLADLQEIIFAADRAAELTRQLLIFSRREAAKPVALDLNEGVRSALRLVGRVIGENIRLETRLAPRACVTRMDPGHFTQVLMNLAVNARDAMPAGGALTIATADGRTPPGAGAGAEPMLLLEVSDTGCGMTPELLARLFEPFFTTKERGKGTGLGLPTVYGIVEQAGGEVRVESAPGKGTKFSIYLPEARLAAAEPARPAAEPKPGGGRGETILFVEDEERLRALGQRMLEAGGYKVVSAAGGKEALEKAAALGRKLDAVVTDLVLPGMNGRELAAELARRGLASRFLYVSGYTHELISRHGVLEEGISFLGKPFTPYTLTAKVREVLDGPPEKARP